MTKRSYAIIGTGALGGYYGARLHHAGHEVHFLLHSDYDHVKAHGLKVESKYGDFSIEKPSVFDDPSRLPAADVVLVALKTTNNYQLADLLPAAVHRGATVLMMQNGLGNEALAAEALEETADAGTHRFLCGLAFLCSHKVGPGHIKHMDYDPVRLGEFRVDNQPAGVTETVKAIAEDFAGAGVKSEVEPDLLLARFKKLVWNVPYNGLCVLLNTTTDKLMQHPPTRALCHQLMEEVADIARAYDRRIESAFIKQMLHDTDKMVSYEPSMKVDFNQGRPLEIGAIYLNSLLAAEEKGVRTPRIRTLYQQLSFIDGRAGAK